MGELKSPVCRPTHHSTGPARKAAQAGEFKRWATRKEPMRTLNRMRVPPPANSREMRAYMQAILEATGLMAGERFNISLFMRNYRTHLKSGRLLKHSDGSYSLSEPGRQYFIGRLTDDPVVKGQFFSRADVLEMLRNITADRPAQGWAPIESGRA